MIVRLHQPVLLLGHSQRQRIQILKVTHIGIFILIFEYQVLGSQILFCSLFFFIRHFDMVVNQALLWVVSVDICFLSFVR